MADGPVRLAVLISGGGTNLQALLDTIAADPDFGGEVVVVGSDVAGAGGLTRAADAGVATEVVAFDAHADRREWEAALAERIAAHRPHAIVLAGFMRILTTTFLGRWPNRVLNVHPSLLPAFPGAHAVRDALAYGVKVTGSTVHLVSDAVDGGPVVTQRALDVHETDDEESLHERLKVIEHEILPAAVKLLCAERLALTGRVVHVLPAEDAAALTPLDFDHAAHPETTELPPEGEA